MDELEKVAAGNSFSVWMTRSVAKQFRKAPARERARCLSWMKRFAEDGHEHLDEHKFKFEGRYSTGDKTGSKVAISAFKAWQLRVYGGPASDSKFICTEIDDSKKQDAADQKLLKSAARKLAAYL